MDKHALTALELKSLRQCRALVFSANLNENGAAAQGVCVRVIVDSKYEGKYEVSFLAPSWLQYYGNDGVRERFAHGRVSAHVDHYKDQDIPVTTILNLIKQGDEISFDWGIGGQSQAMEGLQVTCDTLDLKVRRTIKRDGKPEHRYLTFRLDTRISTDPLSRLITPRR